MTQGSHTGSDRGPKRRRVLATHYGVHEDEDLGIPIFVTHSGPPINLLKLNNLSATIPPVSPVNHVVPVESKQYEQVAKYILDHPVGYALSPLPKKDGRLVYIHESLFEGDWRVAVHELIKMQQPLNTQNHLIPYWGCSSNIYKSPTILNSNASVVCLFDMNLAGKGPPLRDLAYLSSAAPGKIVVVGSVNPNLLKDSFVDSLPLNTPKFVCPEPQSWAALGNAVMYEYMRERTWQKKT